MSDPRSNPARLQLKRSWRQLSLRGLFALMTACAIAAWWYGRPEIVEESYPTGEIKSRAEVIRTADNAIVKNGRWKMWDETGQLRVAGHYGGGEPDKNWKYWHANGQLAAQGRFSNGKMHGPWTQWDERCRKRFEGHYADGVLHGEASSWWDNGTLASQGHYETGKRTGAWTYWDRDGKQVPSHAENPIAISSATTITH